MLQQASGSNADVIFAEETEWGLFPTNPSVWRGMRITPGETLQSSINRFESNELNPTRAVVNVAGGNIRGGGGLPFELSPEGFLTLFKHAMGGSVVSYGSVGNYVHVLKAGNTFPEGISVEKRFNDVNKYLRYWGGKINTLSFNFPQEGYVTGSIDLLAKGEISDENAFENFGSLYGPLGASVAPAAPFSTDEPFVTYLGSLQEGNPLADVTFIRSMTLQLQNNWEAEGFVFGSRYREATAPGKRRVTGQIVIFFRDLVYYNKFLDETATGLKFILNRGNKSIEFYLPRLNYTGESPKISSAGGLTLNLPFQAIYDSTEGTDLRITIRSTEAVA